jgi:deoxyribose-phosphate aldolase
MTESEIIEETRRVLERLLGNSGPALSSGPVEQGPQNVPAGAAPAYAAPAYVRPAASAALPAVSHGHGVYASVPGKLEHSLLDPGISREKIVKECELAGQFGLANVVVSPYYVECAADILGRTGVAVCSVVGFPHGAMSAAAKSAEMRECIRRGATEMDVSLNILAIKSGEVDAARRELQELIQIARGKCLVKAVYEQGAYTDEEKKIVLSLIRDVSCDFLKIQNVLSGKKAEEEDVKFVRGIVGAKVGIKIDGGVKTLERALEVFGAGADRIGLTASVAVAKEALSR